MKTIGFIGVGIMGKGMVRNLMKNGFDVHIYARRPEKVQDVTEEGAKLFGSIGEAVADCDAVITIVGTPADVEEVYLAPGNVFDSAKPGAYFIDMTTSSPTLAEKLYALAKERGFHMIDAPVTGGDAGAAKGTLSILTGGDEADFEAVQPVLKAMGTTITLFGPAGCGQHAKLANQIVVAGTISAIAEAFAYAETKGMDILKLHDALSKGAAGGAQMNGNGKKMVHKDFSPGFMIRHFAKDMRLARDEADAAGLDLCILKRVLANYEELLAEGGSEFGIQDIFRYYVKD